MGQSEVTSRNTFEVYIREIQFIEEKFQNYEVLPFCQARVQHEILNIEVQIKIL